ncbi:MAG TPA: alpha/beta fold hydrolase [Bryobacteraceae bacterium]|nr:alpha/beta fold hydrolase [Bryobacteraceae bacterium]
MRSAALLACIFLASAAPAGHRRFELTVDNIMRGPNLYGYHFAEMRWSGDDQRVYFRWKKYDEPVDKEPAVWVVNRDGSGLRRLSDEEAKNAPPADGDFSPDHKRMAYAQDGDIFVYDFTNDKPLRLTHTTEAESDPHFLHDGARVAYTRNQNLFVVSPATGATVQMTDIRTGTDPEKAKEEKETPEQKYLKAEEKALLAVVRAREAEEEAKKAREQKENPRKPFYLGAEDKVASLRLTPDEKFVFALIEQGSKNIRKTEVPNYVTTSGYTEEIPGRTDVGEPEPHQRLAVIDVSTGQVKWVSFRPDPNKPDLTNSVDLDQPAWSQDGSRAVLFADARDHKDRWLVALDPAQASLRVLAHLHDDAWIGGPEQGDVRPAFVNGGGNVVYLSEQTGWAHVYSVPFAGGEPKALTSGAWEVKNVHASHDGSRLFLVTSEAGLGEQQCYVMPAAGGLVTRLTFASGLHDCVLSPDEKWIVDEYSYVNKPPDLYAQTVSLQPPNTRLTYSPAPDFGDYPWSDLPLFYISARDGAKLPAKLWRPPQQQPGGPGVIFVHGAGYLQDVHRGWTYYAREYMFNHLLAARGYTVVEVDYRASAGYGRNWRTAIYRHMGGIDLTDQVDAAKWLVETQHVDPKRIGIYGGSYGGFLTLMAMFKEPDVFAAGSAQRPVTDWAHYNDGYTSQILNLPQNDPEAYRQSSPIYFADGLRGHLLICHGVVDTNVHFQDTVRLAQKLIELRKENWSVAFYPVENHDFQQPTSWADEYKRILKLFEETIGRR